MNPPRAPLFFHRRTVAMANGEMPIDWRDLFALRPGLSGYSAAPISVKRGVMPKDTNMSPQPCDQGLRPFVADLVVDDKVLEMYGDSISIVTEGGAPLIADSASRSTRMKPGPKQEIMSLSEWVRRFDNGTIPPSESVVAMLFGKSRTELLNEEDLGVLKQYLFVCSENLQGGLEGPVFVGDSAVRNIKAALRYENPILTDQCLHSSSWKK